MLNKAIKEALLRALQGAPVSSLYPPKAKPKKRAHVDPARSGVDPKKRAHVDPARSGVDPKSHARFMEGFHGLPGFKHKAQCETIRDRVWPYIVHAKHDAAPKAKPRAIPPKLNLD